jgi:hypothetical protein
MAFQNRSEDLDYLFETRHTPDEISNRQAKPPRACPLSSKSESAYIKCRVMVLICNRLLDVNYSSGMNFSKRMPKSQNINQTSQDAVLKHVSVNGSLSLEKNQPPEELPLKPQSRSAVGLSHFLLKLSSPFQLMNQHLITKGEIFQLSTWAEKSSNFRFIVSIDCQFSGLIETTGSLRKCDRNSSKSLISLYHLNGIAVICAV